MEFTPIAICSFENGEPAIGSLIPVDSGILTDDRLCAMLSEWRNEHLECFLDQTLSTCDSTRSFLRSYVENSATRGLFIAFDREYEPKGHLGISLDSSSSKVRIESVNFPTKLRTRGFASQAFQSLMESLAQNKQVYAVELEVLSTNLDATRFYERLGFTKVGEVGLAKEVNVNGVRYAPLGNEAKPSEVSSIQLLKTFKH